MLSLDEVSEHSVALTGAVEQPALVVIDLATVHDVSPEQVARAVRVLSERRVVTVGLSHSPLPGSCAALLDALTLTLAPQAPGTAWIKDLDALERIERTIAAAPHAAITLANLLPASARIDVFDGLQAESLAYSMLLAGPEFRDWRARTPRRIVPEVDDPVLATRTGPQLEITLNRPERHNAFGRAIRDGLIDALAIAELDESVEQVVIRGAGRSFCSGGDLDEFGTASDPVSAHLTRLARSAGWTIHRLRERVQVVVHGACIGAGIEVPAFAGRVEARDDAYFQLPELGMGLIPGAGGTVSLTRRIGRHRTAFMALTGDRIDAETALSWGLVDARA